MAGDKIYVTFIIIPYRSRHRRRPTEPRRACLLARARTGSSQIRWALPVLWLAWSLAVLLLMLFVKSTWETQRQSLAASRQQQAKGVSEDLSQAFENLQNLPSIAALEARGLYEQQKLSRSSLERLRASFSPFGRLYALDENLRPFDNKVGPPPPRWLVDLARRQTSPSSRETVLLRPRPVGLLAGKVDLELDPDTPELYLIAVASGAKGELFLAELDLEYVFGPWLKKRLERSSLGEDLTATVSSPYVGTANPEEVDSTNSLAEWRWECPTFFPQDRFPYPALSLTLDNRSALAQQHRSVLVWAAAAALVMVALAVTIATTVKAARRELEYAHALSRFTDMVGHELRTPISAITMYAEILREALIDDPEKLASYHQQLRLQTERLRALTERVLTFARLEQGQAPGSTVNTTARALLELCRRSAEHFAHPLSLLEVAEVELTTDPETVVEILLTLLENAIKVSPPDAPVELKAELDKPGWVAFSVLDRGPGVSNEMQDKLFEPYQSGFGRDRDLWRGGPNSRHTGLGLGLAVAQRLAHSLRGRLEYHERASGGSVFTLLVPQHDRSKD